MMVLTYDDGDGRVYVPNTRPVQRPLQIRIEHVRSAKQFQNKIELNKGMDYSWQRISSLENYECSFFILILCLLYF